MMTLLDELPVIFFCQIVINKLKQSLCEANFQVLRCYFLELFQIKSDSQAIPDGEDSSFCHRLNDMTLQLSFCSRVLLLFPGLQITLISY